MREMSASEASRNFSAVLDAAEHGETIVVHRGGRRVALIAPAPRANGKVLRDIATRWRGRGELDETFAKNVARVRKSVTADLDTDPWRD